MAIWIATERDIGFSAFYRGDPRCLCPYPPNTTEAREWEAGWDKADAYDRETKAIVERNRRMTKDHEQEHEATVVDHGAVKAVEEVDRPRIDARHPEAVQKDNATDEEVETAIDASVGDNPPNKD